MGFVTGQNNLNNDQRQDLPDGPVVKTSPSTAGGAGSIPGQETKIPHASWPKNQSNKTEATLKQIQ